LNFLYALLLVYTVYNTFSKPIFLAY